MREYKFRLWENDRYLYKDFFDRNWYATPYNDENGANCVRALMPRDSIYKLEQYTGLKDKNGVEIYEGDIVKSHGFKVWCYDDKHDDIEYNTFYVRFGKYKQDGSAGEYIASNVLGFYLETIHDYDIVDYEETVSILSSDYDNLELEVIGNIHS